MKLSGRPRMLGSFNDKIDNITISRMNPIIKVKLAMVLN
jgi:hypothetical protein